VTSDEFQRLPWEEYGGGSWTETAESGLRVPLAEVIVATMKFVTSITRDEDGMWIVECPAIPGCVSQGKTRAEALDNAREAIAACLEVRAERGMPLTVETEELEVVA
jgi:predicted RNase H-like HicB family nuclease